MGDFLGVLIGSFADNIYIFIFAVITGVTLWLSYYFARLINRCFEHDGGKKLQKKIYDTLQWLYTLTIALISIFPLLGMLGTVASLVTIDMTAEMDAIQGNFFFALTSTAWGIIWSVAFKIVNSLVQTFIDTQLDRAKDMLTKNGELK